MKIKPNNLG